MKVAETLPGASLQQALASGDRTAESRGEVVYVATLWNLWGYSYGMYVEVDGHHPAMPLDSMVVGLCVPAERSA